MAGSPAAALRALELLAREAPKRHGDEQHGPRCRGACGDDTASAPTRARARMPGISQLARCGANRETGEVPLPRPNPYAPWPLATIRRHWPPQTAGACCGDTAS